MLFQCVVVTGSAADEDGSVKVINTTLKYINSHYEDLVDFDALLGKNDTATGWNLEELPVYSNCDEAVDAIRNSMIHREPEIALAVDVRDLNLAFPDEGAADYEETSAALNNFLYETFMSRPLEHGSVPNGGDYLAFTMVYAPKISMTSDSTWEYVERIELRAAPAYYTTAEQEAAVDAEVARLVEGWKKMGLGDYSTEEGQYAAASAIYSFICDHVVYDHEGLKDENDLTKYSAYAALIEGTSVCQGYANLFYRLALEMGLDARIIGGTGITSTGSGPHAWNIVGLGDKYYNLDATWDAEWYENGLCYEHYLTSASFNVDHIRDAEYAAEGFTSAYPMAEADYFTYTTANGEIESEFTAEEPGYELAYLKGLVSEDELSAAFGESYPGSVDGFPAVEHGTLLEGDVITGVVDGKHCWGEEGNNALMAFDGDPETFFDPVEPSTDYFCGVDLGEGKAYQLTEVRILPRNEWADRIVGGAVQGSNDGKSWTSIVHIDGVENAPAGLNYHCITPYAVYSEEYAELECENLDLRGYWVGEGSYRYYRYVNLNGQHGDVAEIELYGVEANATVKEDDPAGIAWQLENGNLTISGEGAVGYDNPADLPWYSYRNCIQRVNVGYGITEIGEKMFAGYPLLHSISIPGSVKNIGTEAFAGCNSLMNLNLNLGIKALMGNAFTASAVRWAKIPATIETYNWAFSAAPFLEGIELYGEGFAFGTMDEDMLVSSDEKVFFHYPAGRRDTSFTVSSGIETLATHCIDQTILEELSLPFSLKTVQAYAVTENNGLTSLTIPASVSVIDAGAFAYNSALKEVYFYGNYYEEFSDDLFDGAAADLIVYYPDGNNTWNACSWPYPMKPFDAGILADGTVDGISWVITADGTLTFSGEGAIPDYHGFWDGDQPEWFSLQETVNTIVIEEGITDVGAHALRNFDNVTEIRMPDSLKRIGSFAFAECGSLTELNIPAGVEWIETGISWNSQNLSVFRVHGDNEWYNDIDGVLFSESGADLIAYPLGRTNDTYEIPSTVRSIGTAAFENEWDLTSVVLNEGLQFIRDSAFCGVKLTELVIPMTVRHIESWAFNGTDTLTTVVFEGTYPDYFGEFVFYGNHEDLSADMPTNFTITANQNMPGWDQFTEGVLTAENNPDYPLILTDESIETFASGSLDNGMSWYIGLDGTLHVNGKGEMPWYDWEGENEVPWKKYARYSTAIEISEGIIDVSAGAFADLYNAESLSLPETMEWIHDGAFHNCESLEEVYIPARVEHIEGNAFTCNFSVQAFEVDEANEWYESDENGVLYNESMDWLMFYPVGRTDDDGEYMVPGSVYEVNDKAFARTSLRKVIFEDGVTVIGHEAFAESPDLEEVVCGSTVAELKNYVFGNCTSLTKVTFEGPEPIGDSWDLFADTADGFRVLYPAGAGWEIDENGLWYAAPGQGWPAEAYPVEESVIYSGVFSGFTWTLTNMGVLTVTGAGELPQFHNDVENGGVGDAPWYGVRGMVREIVVGEGITALGERSFTDMNYAHSITLPSTLEKLYNNSIGNIAVTEITLPAGLKEIGYGAFESLWNLEAIAVEDRENFEETYTVVDGALYAADMTELILYPCRREGTEFTVHQDVVVIRPSAFKHTDLESITLSESLENIGWWAFAHNHSLTEIIIPVGVNYIASCAFYDCRNLKKATFCGPVPNVENEIFAGTAEEFTVYYPTNMGGWILNEEGMWQPDGNPPYNAEGHEVEVPDEPMDSGSVWVEEIRDEEGNILEERHEIFWTVDWNYGLRFDGEGSMPDWDWEDHAPWLRYQEHIISVVFGDKLTSVGRMTLRDFNHIETITIPGNIKLIQQEAILECNGLTEFVIKDGVTDIRENALSCSGAEIAELRLPASVCDITPNAFGETRVGRFIIEGECEYFTDDEGVLYYWFDEEHTCYALHSFPIGSSITEYTLLEKTVRIDDMAFRWADQLTSVEIPDSVESINRWAFADCRALTEITLPARLKQISHRVFHGCENLREVFFRSNPPEMEDSNFVGCPDDLVISYPEGNIAWEEAVTWEEGAEYGQWPVLYPVYDENGEEIPDQFEYLPIKVKRYASARHLASGEFTEDGYNIRWYIDLAGVLHILGEGSTPHWGWGDDEHAPWYEYREFVTGAVIGQGITDIGRLTFHDFTGMTEVGIADSVTSIYSNAFQFCHALDTVELSANIENVLPGAFNGCSITEFIVDQNNPYYFAADGVLFQYMTDIYEDGMEVPENAEIREYTGIQIVVYKDLWILCQYTDGHERSFYQLPDKTYMIAALAFEYSGALTEIEFNEGLQIIGEGAFYQSGITSATIPASVNTLYTNAFNYCNSLSEIVFEGDLPQFSSNQQFEGLPGDTVISYPSVYTAYQDVIDEDGFWYFGYTDDNGQEVRYGYRTESYTISGNRAEDSFMVDDRCDEEGKLIEAAHDITWYITWNGELHVLGEGSTADWDWEYPAPWYEYHEYVNKVVVHDGITRIGRMNFVHLDCDVELSETVIELAYGAFTDCRDLGTIRLSKNMAYVYGGAFSGSVMDAFDVDDANPIYFDENGVLLERNSVFAQYVEEQPEGSVEAEINGEKLYVFNDIWLLTAYPSGREGESYTVPSNVIYIAEMAFGNSQNLKEINLNPELLYIAQHAFSGCHQITELTIPAGVREVGRNFINSCDNLEKVIFEGCAPMFTDPTVFEGCPEDMVIYYPAGFDAWDRIITYTEEDGYRWNITYVDWDSPAHDEYVVSYRAVPTEPASSGKLAENLFWELTKDGVLRVWGDGAIRNYNDGFCAPWTPLLSEVNAISVEPDKNGSISIGTFAFRNCGAIESITLSEGVTQINSYAFADCVLPGDYVQKIPSTAIIEWSAFACVDINAYDAEGSANGYLTEEDGTFLYYQDEHQKTLLDVGNDVSGEVWLPEGVTDIAGTAFDRCGDMTALMIPASIRYIGSSVFDACTSLTEVYFMGARNDNLMIETDSLFGETGTDVVVRVPKYAKESWNVFYDTDTSWYAKGYFIHGGDVDADLDVDADDALLLSQYYAGLVDPYDISLRGSDVNGDFKYTRADAMVLNRWLAGWNVEFERIVGADE